ncbi:pyruvate:ferredoxin (flavodoxin) oxidoreductase, partial [Klebsiella pneumoniae]|nr:pyruvate:ferredoxin (flavodoxin) oxidoreductase [Klebsiella pneumoniae]
VYVAQIAIGAQMNQTVKAIQEAESYPGPSLIIAYSPCEEHGYDLAFSYDQMKALTASGFWPLYRFDPRRDGTGKAPLVLDSRPPSQSLAEVMHQEQRFNRLSSSDPARAAVLAEKAEQRTAKQYALLELLASQKSEPAGTGIVQEDA